MGVRLSERQPAGKPLLYVDKLFEFLQNENPCHGRNERFVLK
jgi:hypothetical protein